MWGDRSTLWNAPQAGPLASSTDSPRSRSPACPTSAIDRAAAALGIDPASYITLSYGRLFEMWREQHPGAPDDLTFEAIAHVATTK